VEVDDVEPFLVEHTAYLRDRPRRKHDVRQRSVRGHDDGSAHGDDPVGKVTVSTGSRVEKPSHRSGRIMTHDDPDIVPAKAQRVCLILCVLDDPAPVRPGEGNDDADLHPTAGGRRSIPRQDIHSPMASDEARDGIEPPCSCRERARAFARSNRTTVARLAYGRLVGSPVDPS